jgi:hypothetical protein
VVWYKHSVPLEPVPLEPVPACFCGLCVPCQREKKVLARFRFDVCVCALEERGEGEKKEGGIFIKGKRKR